MVYSVSFYRESCHFSSIHVLPSFFYEWFFNSFDGLLYSMSPLLSCGIKILALWLPYSFNYQCFSTIILMLTKFCPLIIITDFLVTDPRAPEVPILWSSIFCIAVTLAGRQSQFLRYWLSFKVLPSPFECMLYLWWCSLFCWGRSCFFLACKSPFCQCC